MRKMLMKLTDVLVKIGQEELRICFKRELFYNQFEFTLDLH